MLNEAGFNEAGSDEAGSDAGDKVEAAVRAALSRLDLDAKTALLAGQDMWSLPAVAEIGLSALVMSDGPVGVRGVRWTAADTSIALPSPTALAATWDPESARRAGHVLAQEARRKGVHVVLAPTVNLHRSPLGGRHFECYSEDPLLTGAIGAGYVSGVQEGGVAPTVKHFVANDAETERFTVNNRVDERTLRELYLAPFEAIVRDAYPWGVMGAYNAVNGTTMTEHDDLVNGVLREEWGFDGFVVSDWFAARHTSRAAAGGLDVAMPGPRTVYGPALAAAVRAGEVDESTVDGAVRDVLRLAARVGALADAPAAVSAAELPEPVDGRAAARELAARSFVLLRNEGGTLPLEQPRSVAVLGAAAAEARVLGGGSAQVFPEHVVSPLEGLQQALPQDAAVHHAAGADPSAELTVAERGFDLQAVVRAADGRVLAEEPLPNGMIQWLGAFPAGVDFAEVHTVEITGTFTPRASGAHSFGTKGFGRFALTVGGTVLFDGTERTASGDVFDAFFAGPVPRGEVDLRAGEAVPVSLLHTVERSAKLSIEAVAFSLAHREPQRDAEELLDEAAAAAAEADTAVVVVATTERVESEGFDRADLRLPGRQDELVARVAAANPRTVVVVNAGSPVEMPWREDVAAVLLAWFPGQEAGAALADVLLGASEPGGRLPTTWPARLADTPVTRVTPDDGELAYEEGVFIGYRAWQRSGANSGSGAEPAYWFGHGLGYTDWSYEAVEVASGAGGELGTLRVRVRNTGGRTGREVVQAYLAAPADDAVDRPARVLAGFATAEAGPGEAAEVRIALPQRAAEIWDTGSHGWRLVPGDYTAEVGRSVADRRLHAPVRVD